MQKKFDYVILIGRFQPFHNGHKSILQYATTVAKYTIVLIGSAHTPRSIKNPFLYSERAQMISRNVDNVLVFPLRDFKYNDQKWISNVQQTVTSAITDLGDEVSTQRIAIIGLNKDSTTEYLNWFPTWELIEVDPVEQANLNATTIRDILFGEKPLSFISGVVPKSSFDFIRSAQTTEWWKLLIEEYEFIQHYKKAWQAAPYPPTFVTVDAVVVQDGHILLVKRGASPGKGQYALPGGFVNQSERLEDAVIRELREETKIKVPVPVLKGSIFATAVFDHPDRSLRGRTITHAYGFKLSSVGNLPRIKGGDDAVDAMWLPLANLDESKMFEDHYSIIQTMIDKM